MPVVPLAARLVPTYSGPGGATAANVLHFLNVDGEFDAATGDFIHGAWLGFWKQLANEDWSMTATSEFTDLGVDPALDITVGLAGDNGDGTGNPLPAQCAFCISLRAGAGRRRKGRIYLPGIGEGDVGDDSKVNSTFTTLALDEFEEMALSIFTNTGWVPAVYSRLDGVARVVAGIQVDQVIDTQRRRVQRLA